MQYVRLGSTGLRVSRICLGTMTFGNETDEEGAHAQLDILHAALPKGPGGQFSYHVPFSNLLMGYSKNQDAAKKFLGWIHSKDVYDKWFVSQKGFSVGPTKVWENHNLWKADPIMLRSALNGGFEIAKEERWAA